MFDPYSSRQAPCRARGPWAARWLLLLATALTLAGTAHAQGGADTTPMKEVRLAEGAFARGAALPAWVEPVAALPAPAQRDDAMQLRLADTQVLVGAVPAYHVHRAMLARAASELDALGNYQIAFNPAYQRLSLHRLRVHRGDQVLDRLGSAEVRFLQREAQLESAIYSGLVTASILVSDVRVGDTLEIAYTVDGANPVLGGRVVETMGWDQPVFTRRRRVSVWIEGTRDPAWKMHDDGRLGQVEPTRGTAHGRRLLRWEAQDLEPVREDAQAPQWFSGARWIQLSEYRGWDEVREWGNTLFTIAPLTPELRAVVDELAREPDEVTRAAAALRWVQKEIRYFSLSLGESSHRPSAPALTLSRRYGDCKDKTLLLVTLLRALGIQAEPVLVSLGNPLGARHILPTPHAFDHVVAVATLGGRRHILDGTELPQATPLAQLGQSLRWHLGLALNDVPGAQVRPLLDGPATAEPDNELHEKVTLSSMEGEARMSVTALWRGVPAQRRRALLESVGRERYAQTLVDPYVKRYPGARLQGAVEFVDDPAANQFGFRMNLSVGAMAESFSEGWRVPILPSNLIGLMETPQQGQRRAPLSLLAYPWFAKYSFEIEFPADVSMMLDPMTREVRGAGFRYGLHRVFRGNVSRTAVELAVTEPEVAAADYPELLARLKEVDRNFPAAVLLPRSALGGGAKTTATAGPRTLRDSITARLTDRAERVSKVLAQGKLKGDDLSTALCDRAEAYMALDRLDDALKDAQAAVDASPNSAEAHGCRASARYHAGQFRAANADYGRQIILGGPEGDVHYYRGIVRFYAADLAGALADFESAAAMRTAEDDASLYPQLWRAWTQRLLGREPTEAQRKLVAPGTRTEWPRPALALLLGQGSVEQVLAAADLGKGDERDMMRAEAYFYIGQHYKLAGDKQRALDYFRKVRDLGVLVYLEHTAAGFELR